MREFLYQLLHRWYCWRDRSDDRYRPLTQRRTRLVYNTKKQRIEILGLPARRFTGEP